MLTEVDDAAAHGDGDRGRAVSRAKLREDVLDVDLDRLLADAERGADLLTNVRALGVGLPYALTASVFGGTVDSVALSFKNAGHESGFFWYATGCIFFSLLFYLFMPDMKRHSRMEQHA